MQAGRIKGITEELYDENDEYLNGGDLKSEDTTHLLYKQHIEDHSSTILQSSLMLMTTPDQKMPKQR
jgi:hypothetical protein